MSEFLMKPKVDFAFKEIMANETVRTGFLAAVLEIDPKSIKETVLLNTNLRREHEDDKQGILDVRLRMNNEAEIDIEIQLAELNVWADRSLFYLARMFTEQIHPGESYRLLKKCVSISILDFVLFKDEENFYSCFHIMEDTRHFRYTDKMEFHVIELPKLPVKESYTKLELWAKFINAEEKEEFDMIAEKDPYIDSAYRQLQIISQDKQLRMEYEAREKAMRDHNEMIYEADKRGEERGRKKGREEGRQNVNKLLSLLIQDNRFADLERCVNDPVFQNQLMGEYGIK